MLKTATKKYISEEIAREEKGPGIPAMLTRFFLAFLALAIPVVMYRLFYNTGSGTTVFAFSAIALLPVLTAWKLTKMSKKIPARFEVTAEVLTIKTRRVIKRLADKENDSSFYIAVSHQGQSKVLFLSNLFVQEKENTSEFPNTEFEIYRHLGTEEVLEIKTKGQPLKPERVLSPFDHTDYEENRVPEDCEIMEINIDQVYSM